MLNDNKGIALLITLSVVVILVATGFELNRQISSSASNTGIRRDMMTLQQKISSGVRIAESILVADKKNTEVDSVQEDWADPEIVQQYLNKTGFEQSSLSVNITDELSRLQINALVGFPAGKEFNEAQRKLWVRFFDLAISLQENSENQNLLSETLEPDMIINPVKDWLDSGDNDAITGLSGAEQDYYRNLNPPYACRNGRFRHVSELLRVKNINADMFFRIDENGGIRDFITVHGMAPSGKDRNNAAYPGKININTAPEPVLAAMLPAGHEFLASEIAAYRKETAGGDFVNNLHDANWYKNVPGMGDVDIDSNLITTKSDLFRISCEAGKQGSRLAATVIVGREKDESGKWQCKVLNWEYE
ncbi:MAG: general secretion pathway protein GspK [Desulfobacteraceae bacterium]|nr:general secretion pathway protein GspK [Desulfobacteraceae bacterium]MCF8094216.1 general secretion pathway protein GspK [Desulfobacteraceae bacterium]